MEAFLKLVENVHPEINVSTDDVPKSPRIGNAFENEIEFQYNPSDAVNEVDSSYANEKHEGRTIDKSTGLN